MYATFQATVPLLSISAHAPYAFKPTEEKEQFNEALSKIREHAYHGHNGGLQRKNTDQTRPTRIWHKTTHT